MYANHRPEKVLNRNGSLLKAWPQNTHLKHDTLSYYNNKPRVVPVPARMVRIEDVRTSNSSFLSKPPGMVALFIGATSGIGLGTLKQFVKYAKAPKVYVVGRSKASAASLLDELKILNPQAIIIFLETQFSLIRNVDKVCSEIKSNEKRVDLVVLSTGYLSFAGRQGN